MNWTNFVVTSFEDIRDTIFLENSLENAQANSVHFVEN